MKEKIFIDTGFWIALFDKRDKYHSLAKKNIKSILNKYRIFLSDFILFETITYLNCSIKNHDLALKFLQKIESTPAIKVLEVDSIIKSKALEIFKKHDDQDFSFVDCTTFVFMKEYSLKKYAGFDKHFQTMGYTSVTV